MASNMNILHIMLKDKLDVSTIYILTNLIVFTDVHDACSKSVSRSEPEEAFLLWSDHNKSGESGGSPLENLKKK